MHLAEPILHIVLVRPEIPQNTGSIARLAAATKARLHLVGPLGFSLEDRYLKRAGLDYWPLVDLRTYEGWEQFAAVHRDPPGTKAKIEIFLDSRRRDLSRGALCARRFSFLAARRRAWGAISCLRIDRAYRIPIFEAGVRSLNLSNAVSIVVYEALRQTGALNAS